jgi:hypothetical protein
MMTGTLFEEQSASSDVPLLWLWVGNNGHFEEQSNFPGVT